MYYCLKGQTKQAIFTMKNPPPPRNVLQINYLRLTANRQILQNVLRITPYHQS